MNERSQGLRLHEEILLLALRDHKGTIENRAAMYKIALGGAMLAELMLENRIAIGSDKKNPVELVDRKGLGDPLLDECLGLIAGAKRRKRASAWISRFSNLSRLKHRVAEGLCRKGILKDSEDKILLFFTRKLYPTIDPAPERALIARLRRAVNGESLTMKPRIGILVALAHATGLLRVHFDRSELKARRKRLETIAKGDIIGGAAGEAVRAAQAATIAVIVASTAATTAATHH